jgi:hypothetical protein
MDTVTVYMRPNFLPELRVSTENKFSLSLTSVMKSHSCCIWKDDSVDTKSFFAELKSHIDIRTSAINVYRETRCASKQQMHQPISKENGERVRTSLSPRAPGIELLDKDRLKKRIEEPLTLKTNGNRCWESLLNGEGVRYFPTTIIIVVEVPEDHLDVCFIYTMVCQLGGQW